MASLAVPAGFPVISSGFLPVTRPIPPIPPAMTPPLAAPTAPLYPTCLIPSMSAVFTASLSVAPFSMAVCAICFIWLLSPIMSVSARMFAISEVASSAPSDAACGKRLFKNVETAPLFFVIFPSSNKRSYPNFSVMASAAPPARPYMTASSVVPPLSSASFVFPAAAPAAITYGVKGPSVAACVPQSNTASPASLANFPRPVLSPISPSYNPSFMFTPPMSG